VLHVQQEQNTIYHLLLYCEVARDLLVSIFRLFGLEWVLPQRMVDLLVCWRGRLGSLEGDFFVLNMVYLDRV
jgi:hypothetical protein